MRCTCMIWKCEVAENVLKVPYSDLSVARVFRVKFCEIRFALAVCYVQVRCIKDSPELFLS